MTVLATVLIVGTIAGCVLSAKPDYFRSLFPDAELRRKVAIYGFGAYLVLLIVVVYGGGGGVEQVYRR